MTPSPERAARPARRRTLLAGLVAAACLAPAAPALALAGDPIMPLFQVQAGMTGTAYTVVRGTDIVTFPVTVLDVSRGAGPGGSLIIIRGEGPLMDQTGGIVEGMSGSPVYVTGADGVPRVIGAIAYGEGDERNVIGGVTPIENMLAATAGTRALSAPAPSVVRRRVLVARDRADATRLRREHPGGRVLVPLTRWEVSGVDARLTAPLARRLGRGVQVDTTEQRTIRPAVPLVPGATLTAMVLGGDIAIGALGTVTYVDGPTLLGFGHPFTGAGNVRLLLGDGWVITTVAAPIKGQSYKLGEPGTLQGMITGDRRDGVVGRVGPVEAVGVHTEAYDARRGTVADLHVQMAPQPELMPVVADVLQAEPVLRVRDGITSGTLRLRITLRGPQLGRPFTYRNVYASAGDTVSLSSGALGRLLTILTQNGVRPLQPGEIEVRQTLDPEIRAATVRQARVIPARVRPGGRARMILTLQRWRGGGMRVTVPIRVPRGIGPGPVPLRVVPHDDSGFDPSLADLSSAITGDAAPLPPVGGRAALAEALAAPGPSRRARVLRALRRATDDRHDAVRLLAPGEEADDASAGVDVAVPGVVISGGRAVARVRVR